MINILPMCQWQCYFFDLIFLIGVSCHSMFILSHCRSYNVTAHNWRGNWCYLLLFRLQRGERSCWITCCSLESLQHFRILSSILLFLIGLVSVTPTLLGKKEAHNRAPEGTAASTNWSLARHPSALLPCTYWGSAHGGGSMTSDQMEPVTSHEHGEGPSTVSTVGKTFVLILWRGCTYHGFMVASCWTAFDYGV